MSIFRIVTIVGARPQFVKAAAFSRALRSRPEFEERLLHTGQHYDENMSAVFFQELGIPEPTYRLSVSGGGHGAMTGRMLAQIEEILVEDRPDAVIIYGDTNSTLAGALAAAKLHIPVVHIEAGLRSFNRRMPEEINRVVADHISSLLLCPTQLAVANLADEGVQAQVEACGDLMYDATLFAIEQAKTRANIVESLGLAPGFALCTIHRQENTDDLDRLGQILDYVREAAGGAQVLFPVHPRTRTRLEGLPNLTRGLMVVDPLGYLDLHRALSECALVLTDSGGLQKEAYFHRKPCVTLRTETEWVETIEAGWNRLWTSPDWISPRTTISDYGEGHSAEVMADALHRFLTHATQA